MNSYPIPSVVFLDRDGTVIRDAQYLSDPDGVELLPGAARAIRRLNMAGIPVVVVTNQSGIGRGLVTLEQYHATSDRLERLLAEQGARIDAGYFCPHSPENVPRCDCRKPATGLFRRAAAERSLDLSNPAFVGDRDRDVAPAHEMGGRGVLVWRDGATAPETVPLRTGNRVDPGGPANPAVVRSLGDAVDMLLGPEQPQRARIAVLASGGGSNMQAILDHFSALGDARAGDVVLVCSDRPRAGALARARAAHVPAEPFDASVPDGLSHLLELHRVQLVALAGYLRLVPDTLVRRFAGRMVNVHPGPLPRFGGAGMFGRHVHEAVLAAGVAQSAATVHLVDECFDRGPVLASWPVPVLPGDTLERLAARVLAAEHIIYPRVLDALAASGDLVPGAASSTPTHSG